MYNNPLFLVNIDKKPYEQIKLQFVPDIVADDESMWVAINSPGRNNPFYHYTGGEDSLEFNLDYHSTVLDRLDVIQRCKLLKSWSRADGYNGIPPRVKLIWGNVLFNEATWIVFKAPFKLTQFHRGWSNEIGLGGNMLPIQAYQNVTLKRVTENNTSTDFIRRLKT